MSVVQEVALLATLNRGVLEQDFAPKTGEIIVAEEFSKSNSYGMELVFCNDNLAISELIGCVVSDIKKLFSCSGVGLADSVPIYIQVKIKLYT